MSATPIEQQSKSPSVKNGARVFPVKNTCKPSSKMTRLARQLAGIEKHLEQNPNDALSQARVAKIRELMRE